MSDDTERDAPRIKLSRCLITGPLDADTPHVVLKEISDTLDLDDELAYVEGESLTDLSRKLDRYLVAACYNVGDFPQYEFLNKLADLAVEVSPSKENFSLIAKFINRNSVWSADSLVEALNFLLSFTKDEPPFPVGDFEYGLQTPASPKKYNACVLYRLCRMKKFPISSSTTIETMASFVYIVSNEINLARALLHNCIYSITDRNALVTCYAYLRNFVPDEDEADNYSIESGYTYYYDRVVTAHENLKRRRFLLERIQPQTIEEAIVLAAALYKTDLTPMNNPIKEYNYLATNPSEYIPSEEEMQKVVRTEPFYLRLDNNFNPILPADLYDEKDLKLLALAEGFTATDLENEQAYTLLQTARLSDTFYAGYHRSIVNDETPIGLEVVSLIPATCLVSFGSKTERLIAVRFQELASLFVECKSFLNPFKKPNENFSQLAMRKLKKICQSTRGVDTNESILEKRNLYMAITEVELLNSNAEAKEVALFVMFTEADESGKVKIQTAISLLFHLSMYMRGWSGSGPYPIEDAPVNNQHEVDVRVTDAIAAFENACSELGSGGDKILDLPLLRYRGGEFMPYIAAAEVQSIRNRLKDVKAGEAIQASDSCIRLGSNFFAMSSYRYMEMIRLVPPFDIDRLRHVS